MRQAMVFLAGFLALAGCGVPRAALDLAQVEAAMPAEPGTDADVTAALLREADQWSTLDGFVTQRELGGILFVDQNFVDLVHRTALAAARLKALVQAGTDDPALRRDELAAYRALWMQVQKYLAG